MQKALLLSAVALVAILAGCTSTPPPPQDLSAHLAVVDGRVNQLVTFEPGRQANELSVAVNPKDPQNVIATGKDYTQPFAGQCVWDGVYVSHDGGAHWKNANLPGSPWKAQEDAKSGQVPQADPTGLSRFYCATDPVVAFGPDGTAYWAVMPYQCDPASGSATGREVVPGSGQGLPPGGFNDWFWTCSSMYVLASTTGGDDWATVTQVAFGPRLQNDKMWLAVGPVTKESPHGKVLLCWDQDSWGSGAPGALGSLTQGTPVPPYQDPPMWPANEPVPVATVCATSDDQARTWQPGADTTGGYKVATDKAALPWVAFDANGTAYMAAVNATHILFLSSADGLAWSDPTPVGTFKDPQNKIMNGFPSLNGSQFRTFALPSLAIDTTNGPNAGALYITWMDAATGQGRTMIAASHDHGKTWSWAWVQDRIGNDTTQRGDQFMPAVSVGPDGTVDLTWMDRRDDPQNHLFDCYYSFSLDGGASFATPLRVSNASSDEKYSHHQNGAIFLGDYRQVASGTGTTHEAHPVWVDTRSHKADVYTATITRPGANPA